MKNSYKQVLVASIIFLVFYFSFAEIGLSKPTKRRNPFADQFPKVDEPIEEEVIGVGSEKPFDVSIYNLTGVVWGAYEARAIINNKIYRIGDKLGRAEVINIDKEGVVVEYNDQEYTIKTKKLWG